MSDSVPKRLYRYARSPPNAAVYAGGGREGVAGGVHWAARDECPPRAPSRAVRLQRERQHDDIPHPRKRSRGWWSCSSGANSSVVFLVVLVSFGCCIGVGGC